MALTFDNVVSETYSRLRLPTNKAEVTTLVERWVNNSLREIHRAEDWNWAIDREVVTTVADKTAGTVSVASGGTTVTGSSTAFAAADVGKFIQFSSSDDWYRITDVANSASLTIEAGYAPTDALSAGTYTIRKFFYSMSSSVEKLLSVTHARTGQHLTAIPYGEFDRRDPFPDDTSRAIQYFVFGEDSSGNVRFMVYPFADEPYLLHVRYKERFTELSAGGTIPLPDDWRTVVIDGALYQGYEYVSIGNPNFDRNIIRGKRSEFKQGIQEMRTAAMPDEDLRVRLKSSDGGLLGLRGPRLPDEFGVT